MSLLKDSRYGARNMEEAVTLGVISLEKIIEK
jgi:hypothetical protein